MSEEREQLAAALTAITGRTPLITRSVINAGKSAQPLPWRKREFGIAISQTRALLDDLLLSQDKLGWHKRGDDAA